MGAEREILRQGSKMRHGVFYFFCRLFDLFDGILVAEADADGAAGALFVVKHCEDHMAWLVKPVGAGRTGGNHHAVIREKKGKRVSVYAVEADV